MFIKCFWECQALQKVGILLLFHRSLSRHDLDVLIITTGVIHSPYNLSGDKNINPTSHHAWFVSCSCLYVTDPQENLNLSKCLFCSILFWHLVITKVFVHLSFPEKKALNTAWMIIGFAGTQIWHYSFGK